MNCIIPRKNKIQDSTGAWEEFFHLLLVDGEFIKATFCVVAYILLSTFVI